MSGLETSAVAISAIALSVALVLAVMLRRARRDLRELRTAVEGLAQQTAARSEPVVYPEPLHNGGPGVRRAATGAAPATVSLPVPTSRADAIVTADGRTIVVPTTAQVVDATMGRPLVRASALAHGLRRALRTENRDRIRSLMRREFQRRRKMRQRAARRAARMAPVHQSEEATYR
jgi:hypothetical protein